MIFDKYLSDIYLNILYSNYDIIINYIEIFELDKNYLNKVLTYLETTYGKNYIKKIGRDMTILDKIIDTTINLEMNEE